MIVLSKIVIFSLMKRGYSLMAIGMGRMLGFKFPKNFAAGIYKLWEESYTVGEIGNTDLRNLLETKEYKKIYIMLGINELGAKQHVTVSEYQKSIEQIQQLELDAIIYVCANLHVTASRSASDELYNNTKKNKKFYG